MFKKLRRVFKKVALTTSHATMSSCNDKVPIWRIFILFAACLSIYLYLYTNAFHGMKTSAVFRVVEGDLKAVWNDRIGSISYYLKLMQQNNANLTLQISSITSLPLSAANPNPTRKNGNATPSTAKPTSTLSWLTEAVKERYARNDSQPVLTLFTSWSDSTDKRLLHNITIRNWNLLRPYVIPVVFTNETSVADDCRENGWEVFPVRVAAAGGVPVLKYMYIDVMNRFNSTFYAYCNGDILFTDSLVETLVALSNSSVDLNKPVMMVGKRTNVNNVTEENGSSWENVKTVAKAKGKLFTGYAEDFFITARSFPWKDIPEVVIGRRAYDNWLIYNARKIKQIVIDITQTTLAVHQTTKAGNFEGHGHKNRDYNHNLLVKMYKRIRYSAGIVDCVEMYTKHQDGNIVVLKRGLPKSCNT